MACNCGLVWRRALVALLWLHAMALATTPVYLSLQKGGPKESPTKAEVAAATLPDAVMRHPKAEQWSSMNNKFCSLMSNISEPLNIVSNSEGSLDTRQDAFHWVDTNAVIQVMRAAVSL